MFHTSFDHPPFPLPGQEGGRNEVCPELGTNPQSRLVPILGTRRRDTARLEELTKRPLVLRMVHNTFDHLPYPNLHRRDRHGPQTLFEDGGREEYLRLLENGRKVWVQGCVLLVAETRHDSLRNLPHHPLLIDDSEQNSRYVIEAEGLQPFDLMAYVVGSAGHQERVDDPLGNYL